MIIKSEITGETYSTVEECLVAEEKYKEALLELQKEYEAFVDKEESAYSKIVDAVKNYQKVYADYSCQIPKSSLMKLMMGVVYDVEDEQ